MTSHIYGRNTIALL